MKKLFALTITLLILSACQAQVPSEPNAPTPNTNTPPVTEKPSTPTNVAISLDIPFILKAGQTATYKANASTITFISVENDSRCPEDVQCVWAGEASLNLKIEGFKPTNDNIPAYSITTMHRTIDLGIGEGNSFTLELIDLSPAKNSTKSISTSEYQATFQLTAK